MLNSSPMVYMNHTKPMFQDLLLYCTEKVPKNHNDFFHFHHGVETHFLVLAQTLIYLIFLLFYWSHFSYFSYVSYCSYISCLVCSRAFQKHITLMGIET